MVLPAEFSEFFLADFIEEIECFYFDLDFDFVS